MIHFFALHKDIQDNYKKYIPHIKAMVNSAIENTSLKSYFIYDGKPDKITRWLDKKGVTTIYHKFMVFTHPDMKKFFEPVFKNKTDYPHLNINVGKGAFLRLDIPFVMDVNKKLDLYRDGNHVLYTDCDVIFEKDPIQAFKFVISGNEDKPFFIAKEFNYNEINPYYNTGVMLMNVDVYKNKVLEFFNYLGKYVEFYRFQDYDQMPLSVFFKDKIGILDDKFNHRPYNGVNKDVFITHYHGLKYHHLKECLQNGKHDNKVLDNLYQKDIKSFNYYFQLFETYLLQSPN